MKLAIASLLAGSAAAFTPSTFNGASVQGSVKSSSSLKMETVEDLGVLAKKLNPVVNFYDPLNLSSASFWGTTQEETIGFLRESEVKHGRIAMFAFVGYIVHANGITWPWPMMLDGTPFPKVSSAPEAWDAIPDEAKLQIFAFVGFLEFWRECNSDKHYMKGGKIGEMPPFDASVIPGGALNLYDPFGKNKNMTEEQKASGLIKEINNGRLAMLGIFGFLSEAKIEGSVPALKGVIPHYDGEVMAPLAKSILPHL
mmetsp:Transcript_3644/g.5027  ORF Transcript_3644/g.5027 Transcript_3644/m.5027 type:complete len:255 (+) Transcript_3644:136-900(+)|eukprot:CAMPEP_0184862240 /NCGR_PEP_ID=MMETSP0580-20130426/6721_1 /TAXON_ID=1118495 /ORGANISM="Dactyliosolen fragilissimus" /LENGTH=254 /DNA_ID=CAMNT_0027360005 /DNA_START=98 /DNA_END=862 /DNA_ORIENTATION=+